MALSLLALQANGASHLIKVTYGQTVSTGANKYCPDNGSGSVVRVLLCAVMILL